MPTNRPTSMVRMPASGIEKNIGTPKELFSQAEAKAPKPKKAECPSEICPVKPTTRFRPRAAMP